MSRLNTDPDPNSHPDSHDILSTSHADTDATDTPVDGDVLTWDDAAGEWVAAPVPEGYDGGGGTITVEEIDGTPSVIDVDTIRFSNGTVTDDGGGQVTVATALALSSAIADIPVPEDATAEEVADKVNEILGATLVGPGGGSGLYEPDAPPSSPNAEDYEFDLASGGVPTGWTEWDPGAKVTVTEGDFGVKQALAASSGDSLGGIYRAIPSGDWSLTTKVAMAAAGNLEAGIFLTEDIAANPTTADIETWAIRYDGGGTFTILIQRWTAYNALSSTQFSHSSRTHGGSIYLRVRRISTNLFFDYSFDGLDWMQAHTMAEPFTIAHYVLGADNRASAAGAAYFRFLRKTSTTTVNQPLLGQVS